MRSKGETGGKREKGDEREESVTSRNQTCYPHNKGECKARWSRESVIGRGGVAKPAKNDLDVHGRQGGETPEFVGDGVQVTGEGLKLPGGMQLQAALHLRLQENVPH